MNEKYRYPIVKGQIINPIHKKWLAAAWEIQTVYGLLHNEFISIGKARELTTAIIEHFSKEQSNQSTL